MYVVLGIIFVLKILMEKYQSFQQSQQAKNQKPPAKCESVPSSVTENVCAFGETTI